MEIENEFFSAMVQMNIRWLSSTQAIATQDNSMGEDGEGLFLLDLQGVLQTSAATEDFSGQYIGRLTARSSGKVTLAIGHHHLEGSRSKLKKPFALLRTEVDETCACVYRPEAIIRETIVFQTRPIHLVKEAEQ